MVTKTYQCLVYADDQLALHYMRYVCMLIGRGGPQAYFQGYLLSNCVEKLGKHQATGF